MHFNLQKPFPVKVEVWKDPKYKVILQGLGEGESVDNYSTYPSSQQILFKEWEVVPNDPTIKLKILKNNKTSPPAGHPGQERTIRIFKKNCYWSIMTQLIRD
ncbi:hypothetical protein O181_044784 [Austropuccinia psidii MF-1]|uniref:Integrase zinc-binding domain-containing protein n=1 Tax=Austropuccinia psidii MF-1 TaxID=1389203 RepID=A0A9Q3DKP4_9BASI|nr:hypothetical protein [Austropuccinia psidii MF-1]